MRSRRRRSAKFSGISRRFEIKGEAAGRIVIDDYAHHPEEVKATLAAARAAFKRRIVAVFQPHRYTRMRDLFDGFLSAFDDADMLCLMDIYSAGEDAIPEVSSHRLYEAIMKRGHLNVRYLGGITGAAQKARGPDDAWRCRADARRGRHLQLGDQLLAELGVERKTHEQA